MRIIADVNIPFVNECFGHFGEITLAAGRDIDSEMVKEADILLVRSITKVDSDLLDGSNVKFAATATIGVDHIDQNYLAEKGIGFSSAPGSNANSVAEYIITAMLELADKGEFELEGKRLGIIGVGNVGSRVEKKARSLGMKLVLNDPPLQRQTGDEKYRPIEEVYSCDFVTIHTPLTYEGEDATYHLADERFFDSLKDGVYFLNSSRGGVVENTAIKKALVSGKLAGAVLDVWENEPDIDLELLEKVDIATPHIAGYSYDGKIAGMFMIYEACCEFFGVEKESRISSFLPEPIVSYVNVSTVRGSVERVMRDVVSRVYAIKNDDQDMRKITRQRCDQRCAYFDLLRKNYPMRREFQNTEIRGVEGVLLEKLKGIGFAC